MSPAKSNRKRTLEELDGDDWGAIPADAPRLARRCFELRKKPLATLSTEDLRVLISQDISVQHVLPEAMRALQVDPLAEGDLFPGDLLLAVLRLPRKVWAGHESLRQDLNQAVKGALVTERMQELSRELREEIEAALDQFTTQ